MTFNSYPERLTGLVRANPQNKIMLKEKVKKIQANYGTCISLGFAFALKVLKERVYKNPISSIFLLSDGSDDGFLGAKEILKRENYQGNVVIHTFGYGMYHDSKLLKSVSDTK
jgi:hypothetical protein